MREMVKITIRLNPPIILILISFTLLTIYPTAYSQTDEESLLQKGIDAVINSQFEEAIIYFDKILENDPQNIKALLNKGVALINLERHSEAINHFDKVLEIDPNNTDALNNKGVALLNLGEYDEAKSYFDRVLELDPENQVAIDVKKIILNRAFQSLLQKGEDAVLNSQFKEAIIYFDKILESDPQNVKALQDKGVALGNLERHSEAIYHFDKVLEIDPNNTDALNNIGAVFINLANYGEALRYFDRVLELDHENQVAINSKKDIQTNPIKTESPLGDKVTTMAAYLQLNIRDLNGNLVNYIETERIFVQNLTRFNHLLDFLGSVEFDYDSGVREGTISIANKNVTKNGQDLQLVTIHHFGNYFGQQLSGSKTIFHLNSTMHIFADHDGYPIRYGDNFDILWNIWRPIS